MHAIKSDVIMTTVASQITSLTIVYSTVYSGAEQRKHQSSGDRWIPRTKLGPVTRRIFPFHDAIKASDLLIQAFS